MAFMQSWLVFICIACFMCRSPITACFITNCPPGGKRSSLNSANQPEVIQLFQTNSLARPRGNAGLLPIRTTALCLACGPDGGGRCLGPHLCCGPSIGCYFKTRETETCSGSPLMNPAACGRPPLFKGHHRKTCRIAGAEADEDGASCVADGVCCSSERCQIDSTCRTDHFYYDRKWNILAAGYPNIRNIK